MYAAAGYWVPVHGKAGRADVVGSQVSWRFAGNWG